MPRRSARSRRRTILRQTNTAKANAAHRVAYSALKHTHKKVGDHWEPKGGGRRGPSDAQARGGVNTHRQTKGGVDANAPRSELYDVAKRLDIHGRSTMSKSELVNAIQKENNRETRKARS
jgi:hypothetical protein